VKKDLDKLLPKKAKSVSGEPRTAAEKYMMAKICPERYFA